jgi:PAS domain S-box-containing protein
MIEAPVERFDLATVIEISQALSGEIVLEKLIDRLMRVTIEHAGAERGLLLTPQGEDLQLSAEAATRGDDVVVRLRDGTYTAADLPESAIRYTVRTRETVILDDASSQNPFSADPYIVAHRARSVFCLPLINQGKLVGILYLENNLMPRVFTPERITVLKVLASQAAISLENTRLYRDLADREAKIRRLVDANVIGIFIAGLEGQIVEANDAFLRILGYEREDLVSGRVRWTELSPPEWRERDMRTQAELNSVGTVQPFEKEYFRKDGSRVPVLVGAALFEKGGDEAVAFVLDLTERKRSENALRESEERFRDIVETTPECVKVVARDGTVLRVNSAGVAMAGAPSAEDVLGRNFFDFVAPEDRTRYREFHEKICDGQKGSLEFDLINAQGVRRCMESYSAPIYGSDGSVAQLGVTRDITERREAEQRLRESEERFRDYAETASDWLWETGPDHKLTRLAGNEFGANAKGRLGTAPWDRALDLETEPEKWRALRATMDSHKPFRDFVYLAVAGDGSPMYMKASGRPVFDTSGGFRGYRGTGTNVTAIIRAEEALRESERSLRSTIDGIPGLVGILAPNGEVESVNRQILDYCGQSLEELKSWGTNGTVHSEDLPHVAEVFSKSIASGIPYQIEQRLRRFDGEYRWFDNRGIPIRDDAGRIIRWYVLLTDIEDRTQALARLRQTQLDFAHINRVSTMGELATTLSHEILHPIATARNNARAGVRFLEMKPPNPDEAKEALACVVKDVDRARDIIGRMRDHIKKAPPRRKALDLKQAVKDVIDLVRSTIASNGVMLSTQLQDEPASVHGDSVQLQQVIVNLILNAIESMSAVERGARQLSIRIEQGQVDGNVLVQVRDSGPGIDPENLERVFEPFYTTKVSGVGMGLSICRSIVSAHGGRLWVEANDPRGAVFQFTLPPAQEDL